MNVKRRKKRRKEISNKKRRELSKTTQPLSGKNSSTIVIWFRSQITKNSQMTQQERLDYLEEGKKVRQKLEEDRLKVEGIKQRKLNELQSLGVEQKYQYELAKKKIV